MKRLRSVANDVLKGQLNDEFRKIVEEIRGDARPRLRQRNESQQSAEPTYTLYIP